MNDVPKLIELLKEMHGKDLDVQNEIYYLFFKDGLFQLWFDDEEKTLKVDVEFLTEGKTFVYQSDKKMNDLLGWLEE